jgi:hypothetical protein
MVTCHWRLIAQWQYWASVMGRWFEALNWLLEGPKFACKLTVRVVQFHALAEEGVEVKIQDLLPLCLILFNISV